MAEVSFAACHAVFDTAELAEAIFLELPMCDILVTVQRTCKHWNDVVRDSTKLQEALFFKPITSEALVFDRSPSTSRHRQSILAHPFCRDNFRANKKYDINAIAGRLEASWRRMQITQPPTATSKLACDTTPFKGEHRSLNATRIGITLGDLAHTLGRPILPCGIFHRIHGWGWWTWPRLNSTVEVPAIMMGALMSKDVGAGAWSFETPEERQQRMEPSS